jgi:hypothetical protein
MLGTWHASLWRIIRSSPSEVREIFLLLILLQAGRVWCLAKSFHKHFEKILSAGLSRLGQSFGNRIEFFERIKSIHFRKATIYILK